MSLVPWRERNQVAPWRDWSSLDTYLDRIFGGLALQPADAPLRDWYPAFDVEETEDSYAVKADLPGLRKEDVNVAVEGNRVTISGERKNERESKNKHYHYVERSYGSFRRSFEMAGGFDASKAKAEFKDGVLTVTIPKNEEARPKKIEVKVK